MIPSLTDLNKQKLSAQAKDDKDDKDGKEELPCGPLVVNLHAIQIQILPDGDKEKDWEDTTRRMVGELDWMGGTNIRLTEWAKQDGPYRGPTSCGEPRQHSGPTRPVVDAVAKILKGWRPQEESLRVGGKNKDRIFIIKDPLIDQALKACIDGKMDGVFSNLEINAHATNPGYVECLKDILLDPKTGWFVCDAMYQTPCLQDNYRMAKYVYRVQI